MLVLTRRSGERILVGPDVVVEIVQISGGKVRVGIQAPDGTLILRQELAVREALQSSPKNGSVSVVSKPATAA